MGFPKEKLNWWPGDGLALVICVILGIGVFQIFGWWGILALGILCIVFWPVG